MAETWSRICDTFWSENFWFFDNVTWADFKDVSPDIYVPKLQDLHLALPLGVLLLLVRYLFERFLVTPIALQLGIKDRRLSVTSHPVLEQTFLRHGGRITSINVKELSKKTDMDVRRVERWLYRRKQKKSHSTLQKFRECSWHFVFYVCSFLYGMVLLWDRNWFWDIKYCVIGWPKQHVDQPLYLFYLVEMGFYWSLLFTCLTDVKRKDFAEQVAHHIITMFLINFSWTFNFVRYGAIIMVLHDVADSWLAGAKMANYAKRNSLSEILFACFLIVWLISRIGLYPFWVIRFIITDTVIIKPSNVRTFFILLLCGLMVLHVIWTYLIFRIIYRKLTNGVMSDVRSDSESGEDEEEDKNIDSYQNENASFENRNGIYVKRKHQRKRH